MSHDKIKMVGRDETGVCLVVKEMESLEEEEDEQDYREEKKNLSVFNEILLNPMFLSDKEEIHAIYKKLVKK